MPDYIPTLTTSSTPFIEVTSAGGVSYTEIQNSIGTYVYQILNLYQRASSISQIMQNILLRKYDKFGNRQLRLMEMNIDPFQFQASLNKNMRNLDYRFDNNNNMYMTVEGNTLINIVIDMIELNRADMLGPNDTFKEIEFLKDYNIDF